MRIIVLGGSGLIGSHIVARLLTEGHQVMGVARDVVAAERRCPEAAWARADLAATPVAAWVALLRGVDAVVNCAGALQDSPHDDLRGVHVEGVARLIAACGPAGVARFVHISAAGVAADGRTPFSRTKAESEATIRASDLAWIILRPGLVLAPAAFGGTALLRGLAAMPLVPVLFSESRVQLIGVDDVAAAVLRALAVDARVRVSIDLVHAEMFSLAGLVRALRGWLGFRPAREVWIPTSAAAVAARLADMLALLGWRSPMRSTTLDQLRGGISGDATMTARLLGREPRSLHAILVDAPAGVQERWFAKSYFLKPLMLTVLFVFWLLSGLIGLTFGRAAAVAVLVGVDPHLALGAVVGGSLVDIVLALAVAHRRLAPRALQGMLVVSAVYLVGGSILRPDLWLDPLGSFLKTVPAALLAACALALMDER
ncbi:SDR family oxidoreductase [Beijerinckia sp. L45]|uniref:SDR family oxidoreductase n=1 Tax=Beijerinckia sp. L45 TaxID=1641855 RepID=UPI00131D32AC|nr:SDR family oxidoreductase [Beijerinckia sp. L45]